MAFCRAFALTVIAAAVCLEAQTVTQAQYEARLSAQLDQVRQTLQPQPKNPIFFGGNLFLAHGAAIPFFSTEALLAYATALRDAGAQRIDINPGTAVWNRNDEASRQIIAKYDALVAHIRKLGLQLAINPEVNVNELSISRFEEFQEAALRSWEIMARRYQPDIFILIHEPTTMARRMGVQATPQQWLSFVQQTAAVVKRASPRSRLGAGGLWSELEHYKLFATVPELDLLPVNIYSLDRLPVYNEMVQIARDARKTVFVEETWRFPYVPHQTANLEEFISTGVGEQSFAALDAKWIDTIAQYAAAQGMEAVVPFWTQAFFAYVTGVPASGENSSSGIDYVYNVKTTEALGRGQITSTGEAFRSLSRQLGRKVISSASTASYASAVVGQSSIVAGFSPEVAGATIVADRLPLPTALANTTVRVLDSQNTARLAPLFFVSERQINYLVPEGTANGPATVTVLRGSSVLAVGIIEVVPVAPGIYTANRNGTGVAAAYVQTIRGDGTQSSTLIFGCDGSGQNCTSAPIDLGSASDQVFLQLFGTGIRGANSVTVIVGGQPGQVMFAGAQSQYPGLDQISVRLPRALLGSGEVTVVVTADGQNANPVRLSIR